MKKKTKSSKKPDLTKLLNRPQTKEEKAMQKEIKKVLGLF